MNDIIKAAALRFIDTTIAQAYQDRNALTNNQYAAAELLAVAFGLDFGAEILYRVRSAATRDPLRRR